jgi:hypothetical protein
MTNCVHLCSHFFNGTYNSIWFAPAFKELPEHGEVCLLIILAIYNPIFCRIEVRFFYSFFKSLLPVSYNRQIAFNGKET